jgi:hypothetical protein
MRLKQYYTYPPTNPSAQTHGFAGAAPYQTSPPMYPSNAASWSHPHGYVDEVSRDMDPHEQKDFETNISEDYQFVDQPGASPDSSDSTNMSSETARSWEFVHRPQPAYADFVPIKFETLPWQQNIFDPGEHASASTYPETAPDAFEDSVSPTEESQSQIDAKELGTGSSKPAAIKADPHYQHLFGKRRTLPAERAKKTKISKRTGPLKNHQRQNAAKMRQITRCLRCRLYKLGVSVIAARKIEFG